MPATQAGKIRAFFKIPARLPWQPRRPNNREQKLMVGFYFT